MPCYQCNRCNKCGMLSTRVVLSCGSCGEPITPGASNCTKCGASLAGNITRGNMMRLNSEGVAEEYSPLDDLTEEELATLPFRPPQ